MDRRGAEHVGNHAANTGERLATSESCCLSALGAIQLPQRPMTVIPVSRSSAQAGSPSQRFSDIDEVLSEDSSRSNVGTHIGFDDDATHIRYPQRVVTQSRHSSDEESSMDENTTKPKKRRYSERIDRCFSKLHLRNHGDQEYSRGHNTSNGDDASAAPQSHFGRRLKSSVTMVDETYHNINQFKYSTFAAIRHLLYKVEDFLGPVVKKLIPNFIFAHYVYIIFMTILCSVILYPQKNIEYIDALVFAAGTCTQGGLQTVQTNDLKLYQQVVIYVICMLTTPIFIHGSLTFLRLYWYEKRFDNIKENSIRQYNMRRSKTIANLRSETMARTMTSAVSAPASNTYGSKRDKNYDSHNASEGLTSRMKRFEKTMNKSDEKQSAPKATKVPPQANGDDNTSSVSSPEKLDNSDDNSNVIADHLSEPSDSESLSLSDRSTDPESQPSDNDGDTGPDPIHHERPARTPYPDQHSSDDYFAAQHDIRSQRGEDLPNTDPNAESPTRGNQNIKFGELPKPSKKKRDLNPRDLYMSISTLQNGLGSRSKEDFESGPALHIKSPRELDEDNKKRHKLRGRRNRRLMRERKLQKLRKRGQQMAEKEKKFLRNEIDELKDEDPGFHLPSSFDINVPNTKNKRSLSMPNKSYNKNAAGPGAGAYTGAYSEKGADVEAPLDPISTNDRMINENLRKMHDTGESGADDGHFFDRSHTMHDFSKRLFSKFDTRPNHSDISDDAITSSDDNDENDDYDNDSDDPRNERYNKQRRTSFFGRAFTGMPKHRTRTMSDPMSMNDDELIDLYDLRKEPTNYLSWDPTIGRNSKFIALTSEEKAELGGVEYQSMKLLTRILVGYYVGFHLICVIFLVAYINQKENYRNDLREVGVNPTWWAFFTSMSSFNDLGYTLNPTSMMLFAENAYTLLISGFFILIGNTAFPIFLRSMIWIMRFFTRPLTMTHNSLSFLLEHPRRCFTLLFPSGPTWWLFAVLVLLNSFDWILFIILDYGSATLSYLPHGYQVLAGLYQAFSTRTAGFNVVNIGTLHPAIQVSYLVMMYISVLPLAISIRRTNVYEEQSLGVYEGDDEAHAENGSKVKFIGAHLRKQLSFDLWFLFLAIFIICIVEGGRIRAGDLNFGIFQIMFEVTSAYGTVGLSLGYPGINVSFCAELSKLSKLVIVATLIRGRHRGLPNSIDRAIMLSNEKLDLRDDIEAFRAMRRTNTMDTAETESLFPSMTRAATGASRHLNREPTIAENIQKGVIPWNRIAKESVKLLGRAITNVLTVNGTPAESYTRQMTRYNTYDNMGLGRNRTRTMQSSRSRRTSSRSGYNDDDDFDLESGHNEHGTESLLDDNEGTDYYDGANNDKHRPHHHKRERRGTYGTTVYNNSESIPLQSLSRSKRDQSGSNLQHQPSSSAADLHGDFMERLHSNAHGLQVPPLQEGSSSEGS